LTPRARLARLRAHAARLVEIATKKVLEPRGPAPHDLIDAAAGGIALYHAAHSPWDYTSRECPVVGKIGAEIDVENAAASIASCPPLS